MYITRVLLENFQRHERFELELTDGVNAIIGTGDRGKSSIIRAIRWCLTNQPDGDDYVRFWYEQDEDGNEIEVRAKKTLVEVELSTGYVVRRIRTVESNSYELVEPNGETTIFKNFRRSLRKGQLVPDAIIEATNIDTIELGDDKNVCVQIQEQHDAPFLIAGLSAPARWRALSKLAGTEIADKTIRSFNADIHAAGTEIKRIDENIEVDQKELKQERTRLEATQTLHTNLNDLFEQARAARVLRNRIDELITAGTQVNEALKTNREDLATATTHVQQLTTLQQKLVENGLVLLKLDDLIRRGERLNKTRQVLKTEFEQSTAIAELYIPREGLKQLIELNKLLFQFDQNDWRLKETKDGLKQLQPLLELAVKQPDTKLYFELANLSQKGKQWQENKAAVESRLAQATKDQTTAETEREKTFQEAGTCPWCRQPIKATTHSSCT